MDKREPMDGRWGAYPAFQPLGGMSGSIFSIGSSVSPPRDVSDSQTSPCCPKHQGEPAMPILGLGGVWDFKIYVSIYICR